MTRVVVFDLEADSKSNGDNFRNTQVTVACAMVLDGAACMAAETREARRAAADAGQAFHWWRHVGSGPDGKGEPMAPLLALFDEADVIVAFNGLSYDFPLLLKHYGGKNRFARHLSHRLKCHDPFSRIKEATGRWPKLDGLLRANGLQTKSSSGLEAIKMWDSGRYDELHAYCADDVRLLAQLVMEPSLVFPDVGMMTEAVFGLRPAIAAAAAATASPKTAPGGHRKSARKSKSKSRSRSRSKSISPKVASIPLAV